MATIKEEAKKQEKVINGSLLTAFENGANFALESSQIIVLYDMKEVTLINQKGDTFTFANNTRNEGLVDFFMSHEEAIKTLKS